MAIKMEDVRNMNDKQMEIFLKAVYSKGRKDNSRGVNEEEFFLKNMTAFQNGENFVIRTVEKW